MNTELKDKNYYSNKKMKCACGGLCEGKCKDDHFWNPNRLNLNKKQNTFKYESPMCPEAFIENDYEGN
jgi:hypothetical protein